MVNISTQNLNIKVKVNNFSHLYNLKGWLPPKYEILWIRARYLLEQNTEKTTVFLVKHFVNKPNIHLYIYPSKKQKHRLEKWCKYLFFKHTPILLIHIIYTHTSSVKFIQERLIKNSQWFIWWCDRLYIEVYLLTLKLCQR